MRLTDISAEYDKETDVHKGRREPISKEGLEEAWTRFISENGDKGLLVGAMKPRFPVRLTEEEYELKVSHPAQEQAVKQSMNQLLDYMRDSLRNDNFSLKVSIDDSVKIKKPLPSKELFQDIVVANHSIAELAKTLDVEIL